MLVDLLLGHLAAERFHLRDLLIERRRCWPTSVDMNSDVAADAVTRNTASKAPSHARPRRDVGVGGARREQDADEARRQALRPAAAVAIRPSWVCVTSSLFRYLGYIRLSLRRCSVTFA